MDEPAGVALVLIGLHLQVGGVTVGAQTADVADLALERPLAPLAGAGPLVDGLGVEAGLGNQHRVGAVIAIDVGVDVAGSPVQNMHPTLPTQALSLLAHVSPGGGAQLLVGLHQPAVLGHLGFFDPARPQIPQAVDLLERIALEPADAVVTLRGGF